ncbi:MAG: signal peptidase I [Alphaproteobacteria bacterium]|nr:signal peptidase I [Alphaproteobacteria bacterium]MCB1840978.1 signal peptidase I [Alphaproteobacteria bacterium]
MSDNEQQSAAGQNEEHKPVLIEKGELGELAKTALLAVFIALLIRTFLFEPFNIPSTSMKPTLLVGDYLFVYKPSYGYSRYSFPFSLAPIEGRIWGKEPQRGDIVVFAQPKYGINLIKRVIGLPGDRIQVTKGRLYINDKIVPREFVRSFEEDKGSEGMVKTYEYRETLPGGVVHSIYEEGDDRNLDNTEVYTVPEEHYFMMGDNRDNSQDSRVQEAVGYVPLEYLIGRADFLFFSTNHYAALFEFWKWPWSIRYERLFMDLDPVRPAQPSSGEAQAMPVNKEKPQG